MTAPTLETAESTPVARTWWTRYCHPRDGDPGVRARLRRCRTPIEALSVRPALTLARQLKIPRVVSGKNEWRLVQALNLARALAHVTADDRSQTPMRAAGWKKFPGERKESDAGEDRPVLSELRFRRLIEVERGEEQVVGFVRLIHLLDGRADVAELANAFLYWNDSTRKRWTFEYYAAGDAAPHDLSTTSEDEA
jgi:CRISPR system Cascade subunit CasB